MRNLSDPTQYTPFFSYRSGRLYCEGVLLERVADQVDTPSYVYSRASIVSAYERFTRALHSLPHTLCYAVKANSNLSILRLFAQLGSSFDIVSGGELARLRRVGVPGRRIVFSGVGKTREEIREALRLGILLFNVESAAELDLLALEASRLRCRARTAIRVNPDVQAGAHPHISTGQHRHKFGVNWSAARKLYMTHRNSKWVQWQGISAHIGSQILEIAPFRRALTRLASYYSELRRTGFELNYLDFGGGLGIRYTDEPAPNWREYARAIVALVRPLNCHLLLEPGRVLVGPAGVLLTRVLYVKRNRNRTFVVVDAAMNDLIRPALYGAVHPVTAAVKAKNVPRQRADVVGPICETGDCFVEDCAVGNLAAGDLLTIWGTGAYGFVAASNYNSRRRPPEVLVQDNRFRLIRRRESFTDLVRGEQV